MEQKNSTGELCLKDYKNIWSKFCFLDESGSLNSPESPFFTIGLIKCSQPYYLYSRLHYERNKRKFYDEMKFNKLSKRNIDFCKFAVESFLDTRSVNFYSYTVDKMGDYFKREFGGDQWVAYEKISARLSEAALSQNEILIIIADHITVPKAVKYEVNLKNALNNKTGKLSIAGVCRFDSKGNDLLQIVDLFIGSINYDLKIKTGIVTSGDKNKKEFVKFLKCNLGADSFIDGFRSRVFNVFVDKDAKRRLLS